MSTAATGLLRPGLLDGRTLLLAHVADTGLGRLVRETCEGLGADVHALGSERADEQVELERLLSEASAPDVLVIDLGSMFAAATGQPSARLVHCMDGAWSVTRAVAAGAFLPAGEEPSRGGRVIYLAPAPDAGEHADAVRAAAENLARTLSIEWARFAVTTVAIAPGTTTGAQDIATLIAYLSCAAGAYFSGCQLDLRGV